VEVRRAFSDHGKYAIREAVKRLEDVGCLVRTITWNVYEHPALNPRWKKGNGLKIRPSDSEIVGRKSDQKGLKIRPKRSENQPLHKTKTKTVVRRPLRSRLATKTARFARSAGGESVSFFPTDKTPQEQSIEKLCHEFAIFSASKGFHLGKRGSDKNGWTKRTVQSWIKPLSHLIITQQTPIEDVSEVMHWYFEHCGESQWIKKVRTIGGFCEAYSNLLDSMERTGDTSLNNGKIERAKVRIVVINKNQNEDTEL
jgi:hypothetical protein